MKQAFIRLAVLVILLINQTLMVLGWSPLPFSEEQIYEGVSSVALVVIAVWTWYKNNDTTDEARAGTQYMKELKESKKGGGK